MYKITRTCIYCKGKSKKLAYSFETKDNYLKNTVCYGCNKLLEKLDSINNLIIIKKSNLEYHLNEIDKITKRITNAEKEYKNIQFDLNNMVK